MDQSEFATAFARQVRLAVDTARQRLGRRLPDNIVIELHGSGQEAARMTVDEAAESLFLGADRFYRIIDLGVVGADEVTTRVFVRPSNHRPGVWSQTWDPAGAGPFKQLGPGLHLVEHPGDGSDGVIET